MAVFPSAVATDSDLYIAVNQLSCTLTDNPLTSGATTVNVNDTTGFPSVGFISIDSEIIKYTAKTGTSFTGCTRASDGTSAASHVVSSQVFHMVIAAHHNALKDEIKAIETFLNTKMGTSGSAYTTSRALQTNSSTGIIEVSSVTNTELGYLSGVTSAIQTQFSGKASLALDNLASVAINTSLLAASDNATDLGSTSKNWRTLYVSTSIKNGSTTLATATELGYLSGVTSAIQTQISGKATKALDNLASVAINTSLLPASDNAIDAGSTSKAFSNVYARNLNGSYFSGLRNKLVNADMRFDQRKEGSAYTSNSLTAALSLDQWWTTAATSAGVFTVQRSSTTPPTGFNYYARVTVTTNDASPAAGASYSIRQDVEVDHLPDIVFPTSVSAVTISFWVRSSLTGTFGVGFVNLIASSIRSYIGQYTINSANTWEYKTVVIPADTGLTNTMTYGNYAVQVRFDLGSGSNRESTANQWNTAAAWRASSNTKVIGTNSATWDVTGVQLEAGAIPTSFEFLPFDIALMRCQRYYEKSLKVGIAPGSSDASNQYIVNASQFNTTSMEAGNIAFKVRKRTVPTVTLYKSDGSNNNFDWVNTSGTTTNRTTTVPEITETAFAVRQTVAVEYMGIGHWVADAA